MSALSFSKALRNGSSALALSTIAMIGAQPALATDGIFGGGSTLASLAERQVGDDYLSYTSSSVLLLYAGVGSGSGLRGFISNDPQNLFLGSGAYPAANPPYLNAGLGFSTYPYPRIDFGASDSPLPSNFTSGYNTTSYAWAGGATTPNGTVTYPTSTFGEAIQLPLFEAPVAIAVNLPEVDQSTGTTTAGGVTWTIKSQFSTTAPGGRIQLSTAQICAIFSGLVTDWNSTASIAYLTNAGAVAHESFADANTWHATSGGGTPGTGGGTPYAVTSAPITIVYRSDGSGTSFIFTNYLKTVCPLLDDGSNKYATIFGASNLPNNSFTQLINNVTAQLRSLNTVPASGSDAVAAAVGNTSANYGYIGYLSNDFVAPYNPSTATTIPHAASLQNDYQRYASIYHPGDSTTDFIAATPASADAAWAVLDLPASEAFNDWNIYSQVYASGTDLNSGIGGDRYTPTAAPRDISNLSKLPLAPAQEAYPIVGTAYLFVYSCYGAGRDSVADTTRVTNLVDYLKYHYGVTAPGNAGGIISANGFGPLPSSSLHNWVSKVNNSYLGGTSTNWKIKARSSGQTEGCWNVSSASDGAH